MDETSLCFLAAADLSQAIRKKEISPVEVLNAVLSRIERLNPRVNAFCTVVAETAREEARRAEEAVVRREKIGPLHGVPVSVKDLILTAGVRTTFGSRLYENFVPDVDEIAVQRLKAAGAILLGKTNTCEFGFKAVTDNPLFGATRNPWNLERTPAGSSGGAAAAVACGLGPLALGSDGGGSIRAPASFCRVFGFKPTRGRMPIYPFLPGWETLGRRVSHLGPLTRTAEDAALMMDVLAGPDERDPSSVGGKKVSYRRNIRRGLGDLHVAWTTRLGEAVVEPEVRGALESAAGIFNDLKCHVEEVEIPLPSLHDAFQILFAADCAAAVGERLEGWRDRLDPGFARLVEIGLLASAADYVRAANRCHLLWPEFFQPFFRKYDLLLTPVLPVPPFPLGVDWPREVAGQKVHPLNYLAFTYPFNLTGQPAASVPCGWSSERLPIGVQVVGRPFEDLIVLRAAALFEDSRPWLCERPELEP